MPKLLTIDQRAKIQSQKKRGGGVNLTPPFKSSKVKYFSPLVDEIFKTRANCWSRSQLINIFCNKIYVARNLLRHRYCAIPFFEIQDGRLIFCTLSKFKAFVSQLTFQNVGNKTKMVLATLIALNTRNLSEILTLEAF